jgi:DNA-binding CsgD family transcriptional regulator
VLRPNGALLRANASFEALLPAVGQDFSERLKLNEPAADQLFADALSRSKLVAATVSSIPLAATEERLPLILHLLPIRGAAHDVFSQATSLLVVTPVDRSAVPQSKVLQGLFDLTPAEARVAQAIGEAQSIEHIATQSGVSLETIRSQLKSVLSKTGLSRQQELVHLLAGKVLPVFGPSE